MAMLNPRSNRIWDGVTIGLQSKLIVQLEVGPRDSALIEPLMRHSAERLANPHDLLLMTDDEVTYRSLFPEIFGVPRPGASLTSATVSLAP